MEESALYPIKDYTMNTEDVGAMLGYTIHHVRRLAQRGKIPALKLGREWFFHPQELEDHYHKATIDIIEKTNERDIESGTNSGGKALL